MQVRLHKTVEFCNIFLIFAKTLQISRKYFQFPLLSVNYGSTKPLPLGRKKSAAPGLGATLVQFGHVRFSIWSCAAQSDKVALWICTLAVTFAAPGTAHPRQGNCTLAPGEPQNRHGEPQGATQQRPGTAQKRLGTAQWLPGRSRSLGINTGATLYTKAAESCTTASLWKVLFIGRQREYYRITIW